MPSTHAKPGHAALRRGRVSIAGQLYHVTTATAGRTRWFGSLPLARIVARNLNTAEAIGDSQTLCWVLMPDHLHWLLRLGTDQTLSQLVGRFKKTTSHEINLHLVRRGQAIWAPSFHDHSLRSDEDVQTIARYIVANPVRAGLCESKRTYPHWDCIWPWEW